MPVDQWELQDVPHLLMEHVLLVHAVHRAALFW